MESSFDLLAVAFCVLCLGLVFGRLKYSAKRDAHRKLPGFRPRFLVGNVCSIRALIQKNKKRLMSDAFYDRIGTSSIFHKEGLFQYWLGPVFTVYITRARTAEVVLSSQELIEKSRLYHTLSEPLGTGLITSGGDKWRKDRKAISPAFHFRVLDGFLEVMNDHSLTLVKVLRRESRGRKWLDPQKAVNNCVLDILLESSLDSKLMESEYQVDIVKRVNRICDLIVKRAFSPWSFSDIYYLFPEGREFSQLVQNVNSIVDEIIEKKITSKKAKETRAANPKRKIFIDLLLEGEMTRKDLRDQFNTFLAAGHHTVGYSLCWLLYLLGRHDEVQSKLLDEIGRVFPGGEVEHVTKEHLQELKYMDCVVKECHRLYPSVPEIIRLLTEDTVIGDYCIPKDTNCTISIAAIHRDPDVYPVPELFDPDRFLPENSVGRSQYAFIPFSAGPRNCIGQRYAHMEIKVVLCHVISNLRVHSLDPEDKIVFLPEIVTKPLNELRIAFAPRDVST